MKLARKLAVALLLTGVFVGIAEVDAVRGQQANSAPVYFVSEVSAITDAEALKSYRAKVGDTLAPFTGHYFFVVRARDVKNLEDDAPPASVAVMAWDTLDNALAWYNSPAYAAIRPIFQGATKGRRTFLVQGLP